MELNVTMATYEISIRYRVIADNEDKARNHALGKTDDWFQCDDFGGKDGVYVQGCESISVVMTSPDDEWDFDCDDDENLEQLIEELEQIAQLI